MHANNDPLGVRSAYPFPGADAVEALLEFASCQTGFSSSGRIVIVGPIRQAAGASAQRLKRPSPVSYEQVITMVRNRRSLCTRGGE
jgi:hypothetical protein